MPELAFHPYVPDRQNGGIRQQPGSPDKQQQEAGEQSQPEDKLCSATRAPFLLPRFSVTLIGIEQTLAAHGAALPESGRCCLLPASICMTSSSKSIPACRADLGTRLWLVMPGMVFTSMNHGRPSRSSRRSTRPHPPAPSNRKALSA